MNGQDLHHLESFKSMNPPGDLKEGSEMIMTIKGDTMTYRSSEGAMGIIKSQVSILGGGRERKSHQG